MKKIGISHRSRVSFTEIPASEYEISAGIFPA